MRYAAPCGTRSSTEELQLEVTMKKKSGKPGKAATSCGTCEWIWRPAVPILELSGKWVLFLNNCDKSCNPWKPIKPGTQLGETRVTPCIPKRLRVVGSECANAWCEWEWDSANNVWRCIDDTRCTNCGGCRNGNFGPPMLSTRLDAPCVNTFGEKHERKVAKKRKTKKK